MARPLKRTLEEFVALAKAKHGNRYDYTGINYRGSQWRVHILCKHGGFSSYPNDHLRGQECRHCKDERRRRGRVKSWVYLLVAQNINIANFGRTEDAKTRTASQERSENVTYDRVRWIGPLTSNRAKDLESHLLLELKRREIKPIQHRNEVFRMTRRVAKRIFDFALQQWIESRSSKTGHI
jgi:hypothetical protein